MTNLPNDVTIISGEYDEIQTNKYLLSLFSPNLRHLLSTPCCITSSIFLPGCSTFSIKYLLDIITTGYTFTEGIFSEDTEEINEIRETAELLSIDIGKLDSDENIYIEDLEKEGRNHKINESKKKNSQSRINIPENKEVEKNESILDALDSLCKILDIAYDSEEENNEPKKAENTSVRNVDPGKETEMSMKGVKRKRTEEEQRNSEGRYKCQRCEYQTKYSGNLNTHVESIHEGVRYPCNQCDYKATTSGNLKKHVESIHEGVRYPCNQCNYKATLKADLKRHNKLKHIN